MTMRWEVPLLLFLTHPVLIIGLDGNVRVAGVFQIFQPHQGKTCGSDVEISSVQHLEAVKWLFKNLNDRDYIPGIKLGLDVVKTCRVEELAAEAAFEIVRVHENYKDDRCSTQAEPPVVAVIGPESSQEAEIMSSIFSSVPGHSQILQFGYSVTASTLNDRNLYPNFHRVIQDDSLEIQVMVALMKKIEWNYITIIFENTGYGRKKKDRLKKASEDQNICVPITHEIKLEEGGAVSIDDLTNIVNNMTRSNPRVGGAVFFGSPKTANILLSVIDSELSVIKETPALIFSESTGLEKKRFLSDGQPMPAGKGSFVVSAVKTDVPKFKQYWINLMQDKNQLLLESQSNPWLLDVHNNVAGCRLIENSKTCNGLSEEEASKTFVDSVYTSYALKAAYTIAKAIKLTVQEKCMHDMYSNCSSVLHRSDLLGVIPGLTVDFLVDFPFDAFDGPSQSFDDNGNMEYAIGAPLLEVYNYQDCGGEFCFLKLGHWQDGTLDIETNKIKDYNSKGEELNWPTIRHAQCLPDHQCTECVHVDSASTFYFEDGDLIVGAIVPIYNKDTDPLGCGGIRPAVGFEIAESMSFIVKKVNEKKLVYQNIFPGMKVGIVVINTCNSPLVLENRLLSLLKNGVPLADGRMVNIRNKLIGFIGALGSSISIAAQRVLKEMKYVQISYASTNPSLSNRMDYPYFMRTTTPDDKQALTMIDILKKLGYTYIQILHSVGSYGEGGRDAIQMITEDNSICIAQIISIEENVGYNRVVEDLRKKAHAKAVIVFLRSHVISNLMSQINEDMSDGEFHFIGSEAWGTNSDLLKNNYKLVGSISLLLEMTQNAEFTTHLNDLWPGDQNTNPWLLPYMQKKKKCYFPLSFDKNEDRECSKADDSLVSGVAFQQDMWSPFAMNSLRALLLGANITFETQCGHIEYLCPNFINNPEKLVKNIKNVELDINQNGQKVRIFDDNGDGTIGYKVYNIQRDTRDNTKLRYVNVGQAPLGGNFQLFDDKMWYPGGEPTVSECPNEKRCSECFPKMPDDSVPEPEDNTAMSALAGLVGTLFVVLIILIIVFVLILRRMKTTLRKMGKTDYITPASVGSSLHNYTGVEEQRVDIVTACDNNAYCPNELEVDNN